MCVLCMIYLCHCFPYYKSYSLFLCIILCVIICMYMYVYIMYLCDCFPSISFPFNRTHIAQVIPKFMEICRTSGELL